MNLVVPWNELFALIDPFAPLGNTGRPRFASSTMLRVDFMQQRFGMSDPAMEKALHDALFFCNFAGIDAGATRPPDKSTILRFRHMLEANDLATQMFAVVDAKLIDRGLLLNAGTVVDATLITAHSSTKNDSGERDPEMRQTKKGNQWHFGMKALIEADADSGLVYRVATTAANAQDVTQEHELLQGQEGILFGDLGCRGVDNRPEVQAQHLEVNWLMAMMPAKRKALNKAETVRAFVEQLEKVKTKMRAKAEHPFRVIKCQFSHRKARCRGLTKNTAQLVALFVLSNLWMVRKPIMQGAMG